MGDQIRQSLDIIRNLANAPVQQLVNAVAGLTALSEDDENIEEIRELGGNKALVELLNHADPTVQRKACAALTNMSSERESCLEIIELGAVPRLAHLMAKGANVGVKSYACGVVSNIAREDKGREAFIKDGSDGIAAVIEGMRSDDIDFKIAAAGAMGYLCFSSNCSRVFRELDGFGPLAQCLTVLSQSTGDPAADEDLLIKTTGSLWNCGLNSENAAAVRKSGAIELLVPLLRDAPTQEVVANAITALCTVTTDSESIDIVLKNGGVPLIVDLIKQQDDPSSDHNATMMVKSALHTTGNMAAVSERSRQEFKEADIVQTLFWLLARTKSEAILERLWYAFAMLANEPSLSAEFREKGLVKNALPLLQQVGGLASQDRLKTMLNALRAMANMVRTDYESRIALRRERVLDVVVRLLSLQNEQFQEYSCNTIEFAALDDDNAEKIRDLKGIPPLVRLLASPNPRIQRSAANALFILTRNKENLKEVKNLGALDALINALKAHGRNDLEHLGYDKDGFDSEGYDRDGYDRKGFNRQGYDRNGFDRDGFDKNGYDKDGYDRNGYNRDGFDRKGFDRNGYDKDGYDKNGFDRNGYNRAGFDKDGFDRSGFDKDGYDRNGFNRQGYNRAGFDKNGFDKDGFDKNGYDKDGYDRNGYNRNGFNRAGFDRNGYDRNGYDKDGFDRNGFDRNGYDRNGYDKDGFDKDGYDRDGYDRQGYNRAGVNREGLTRDGFDADGYNKEGYDRWGFDRNGRDKQGYDRCGRDAEGYDREGFDRQGYNRQGLDRKGRKKEAPEDKPDEKKGFDLEGGSWKDGQENTFTRWCNHHLQGHGDGNTKINDLFTDLADGTKLVALLESLTGGPLPQSSKIKQNPTMRIHKIQNLNLALQFITENLGMKLTNISAEDITDGNPTIILGLIWQLILKFQVNKQAASGALAGVQAAYDQANNKSAAPAANSKPAPQQQQQQQQMTTAKAKQELLEWLQRQVKPYAKYLPQGVTNFTTSFQNGLVLCALVDSMIPTHGAVRMPTLIVDKSVDPECWMYNNECAINMAYLHLGIPNVVNGCDIARNPDELSIITYVSYFKERQNLTRKF